MGTMMQEAVRKAVDPFGIDGTDLSHRRPSPSEVVERLYTLGYEIVPRRPIDPDDGYGQFLRVDDGPHTNA